MNKVASFQILLVCSHVASAALHSLWHVYTVSSGIPRLPPVTAAVLVDGVTTEYYDSRTGTAVAKQAWMDAVVRRHPDYWKEQTAFWQGQEHFGNINMAILLNRFNQSDGVHVFQVLHGCEYDDESGDESGFNRHSYDGDTTLVLDVERRMWMALKPQLEPTGRKWNLNEGWLEFMEHRLLRECPPRLRETLQYGKDFLRRIQRPLVSLLQTEPSAPVTCHATGFHPGKADVFWTHDDEQLHDDRVEHGQLLRNHDGTFQLAVRLRVAGVPPADWRRYACVFRLDGLAETIVTALDAAEIKTNYVKPADHTVVILAAVVFVAALAASAGAGIFVHRKRRHERRGDAATRRDANTGLCVYTDAGEDVLGGGDQQGETLQSSLRKQTVVTCPQVCPPH
ncbi:major histocompatibility complex class I-related gene protein-like isoform X1 [Phyllopteryx taeniolatus]|uniref:major histocompatibility complex class I-related gene protein-like isoform X1 n=2 Tax=Phyllopteryx taeniolatus TaxID=161469 RepID=UPI002AD265D2|nr:major histocompatibility complex class I-related gene protein-like isoform X1 [Phyllopteryx taeniolatus]